MGKMEFYRTGNLVHRRDEHGQWTFYDIALRSGAPNRAGEPVDGIPEGVPTVITASGLVWPEKVRGEFRTKSKAYGNGTHDSQAEMDANIGEMPVVTREELWDMMDLDRMLNEPAPPAEPWKVEFWKDGAPWITATHADLIMDAWTARHRLAWFISDAGPYMPMTPEGKDVCTEDEFLDELIGHFAPFYFGGRVRR